MLPRPSHARRLPAPFLGGDPTTTQLTVDLDLVAGRITLDGELDRHTAHHLLDAATALADGTHRTWLLDVRGLHFCDTAGLRAISAIYRRALRHDARLSLIGPGLSLQRALATLRLDGHLAPEPAAVRPPELQRATG